MTDPGIEVAVVAGATGGIGRAVALRLARRGLRLHLLSRSRERLAALIREIETEGGTGIAHTIDFLEAVQAEQVSCMIRDCEPCVHVLVHAAGHLEPGTTASATIEGLDRHVAANLRGPYLLTQHLLRPLVAAAGQVVFINSSVVQFASPTTGQYAASKHALKGFADSLRAELNAAGVRVLSVFPGRTASEMQRDVHAQDGRPYHPEKLLQPDEVAAMIDAALNLPRTAEVTEVHMRPMARTF